MDIWTARDLLGVNGYIRVSDLMLLEHGDTNI